MEALYKAFGDHVINLGLWHPHSPDLTPCAYNFWESLKDKSYKTNPTVCKTQETSARIFKEFTRKESREVTPPFSTGIHRMHSVRMAIFSLSSVALVRFH
jgi:hypothetical protein